MLGYFVGLFFRGGGNEDDDLAGVFHVDLSSTLRFNFHPHLNPLPSRERGVGESSPVKWDDKI